MSEVEKNQEKLPVIHFGDVVIDPAVGHGERMVVINTRGKDIEASNIKVDASTGTEFITRAGAIPNSAMIVPGEKWDTDRILAALLYFHGQDGPVDQEFHDMLQQGLKAAKQADRELTDHNYVNNN